MTKKVIYYVNQFFGGLGGEDVFCLLFGGNEEDLATTAGHFLEDLGCLVDFHDGLVQVDDVDTVPLNEDIRSHLGVPLAGKVSEVSACIKQLFKICSRHGFVFVFVLNSFINPK